MLFFVNDYCEGAHPRILERLMETNMEKLPGYGSDCYCEAAADKIRAACGCPDAGVSFLVGGTQTNATVIDALLQQYQGVVSAETGHIASHEAGAIEASGHKVLGLPQKAGKIDARTLADYLRDFYADDNCEHMVLPGMVYISHPTEYGTLYTKAELTALAAVCRDYDIPLFLDGARLGYGLAAEGSDVTLEDIAACCDVFYAGGTKMGALCGEAVVFPRKTPDHFLTRTKQHGALLAKGRLLGIQFDTLFTDGLYLELGRHADAMAALMARGFADKGYEFYLPLETNQLFIRLENSQAEALGQKVAFSFWEKDGDDHQVVRFATSWATLEAEVRELIALL